MVVPSTEKSNPLRNGSFMERILMVKMVCSCSGLAYIKCGHRAHMLLLACFLWTFVYLVLWRLPMIRRYLPPSPKAARPNASSGISAFDMGISQEEWDRLQKAFDWPGPDHEITQLILTTSPDYTTFSIVRLNDTYKIGDTVRVTITARDHNNNLKTYGGDFFQVKLFNLNLKASVYGEVIDHRNGTYTVDLLLPWEGQGQVSVRLMYSSELVWSLNKYWETSFPRSHYIGYFEGPGPNGVKIIEKVECNLKWGSLGSWSKGNCCCEYKDEKTETVWQCDRPKQLSCDHWVQHENGAIEVQLTAFERQLCSRKLSDVGIAGDSHITSVLPNTAGIAKTPRCRSGLITPVPAGFYFQDVWKSFVCNTRSFSPPQMAACLKNKILYMLGDSTTRQWFEFFESSVPGLKRLDIHTSFNTGPLMAVELTNNIIIHWRTHGFPLRFHKMPAADLHYISNEIDYITGGRHTVVVFTIAAHMAFHPLTFFVHKLGKIRQAVVRLLKRAPETTIIIKSGNTGISVNDFGHEWYRMQINKALSEMFSDIDGVIYMDVWQMTSCHYTHEAIHPATVIVGNEIDMLLSYVCPS
ncbi:NXPE family member 3-like isoform X1 [Triplophysa dalaica]|uniref:NXPE family member 3-like isoform X1 n=1 Tax=Triplophysa dalaica TaxID=1582913 RepID=UPI0024DFD18C|nr:NXPE family member 3-like isoform X1 [Triplophysa dalaica]